MRGVTGAFQIAGQAAGFAAARNVAHAAAETYGIGAYHSFLPAFIAQYHHTVVIASFVESKSTEVYPCAAANALVNFKLCDTAVVEYEVFGIAYAVRQALIGNVYGVLSGFRNIGNPLGEGFVFLLFGLREACRAVKERIFSFRIDALPLCKSRQRGLFPTCFPAFHFEIEGVCTVPVAVVVYDDFPFLRVAFARGEYVGSRIFQHRDEVGEDERLRELVFGGTEQAGTLPAPFVLAVDVVPSVTLPQGDVPSFQSPGYFKGTGCAGHPGGAFVMYVRKQAVFIFLSVSVCVGDKVADGTSAGKDGDVEIGNGAGEYLLDVPVSLFHRFRPEGLVGEFIIGIDADGFSAEVYAYAVEPACTDIDIGRGICLEEGLQPLPDGLFYFL